MGTVSLSLTTRKAGPSGSMSSPSPCATGMPRGHRDPVRPNDTLQSLTVLEHDHLLTITDSGYGSDRVRGVPWPRPGHRGSSTSGWIRARGRGRPVVSPGDEVHCHVSSGNVMRTRVDEILHPEAEHPAASRIMNLEEGDKIVGVAVIRAETGEKGT